MQSPWDQVPPGGMSRDSNENPPVSASGGNVQKAAHVKRKNKCQSEKDKEVIRRLNEQREVAIRLRKQNRTKAIKQKIKLRMQWNDVKQSREQTS